MFRNKSILENAYGHSQAGHDEEPHVTSLKVYFGVFAALMVLTVVTVGVSLLGLPASAALTVAILVALVKASIVALWFMHLISEERFFGFILVSTVFFMALFFVLTLVDLSGRGATNIEETPEYWRSFSHVNSEKAQEAVVPVSPAPVELK